MLSSFSSQDSGCGCCQDDFLLFLEMDIPIFLLCVNTGKNNTDSLSKGNTSYMKQKLLLKLSTQHCIVQNSLDRLARIIVSAVTRCVITCKYFCI